MNTGWICGGGGSNETYAGVIWQLRRVLRVRCRRLHGQEGKGAAHNKRDVTIWSARLKGDGVGGVGATGEAAIGEGCAARSYSGRGRLLSLAVRGGGTQSRGVLRNPGIKGKVIGGGNVALDCLSSRFRGRKSSNPPPCDTMARQWTRPVLRPPCLPFSVLILYGQETLHGVVSRWGVSPLQ